MRRAGPPPLVPLRGNTVAVINGDIEQALKMVKKLAGPDLQTLAHHHTYYSRPGVMRIMKTRLARKKLAKSRKRQILAERRAELAGA